jgi:hypothetical protein
MGRWARRSNWGRKELPEGIAARKLARQERAGCVAACGLRRGPLWVMSAVFRGVLDESAFPPKLTVGADIADGWPVPIRGSSHSRAAAASGGPGAARISSNAVFSRRILPLLHLTICLLRIRWSPRITSRVLRSSPPADSPVWGRYQMAVTREVD